MKPFAYIFTLCELQLENVNLIQRLSQQKWVTLLHSPRYTNAHLKISLYVRVHIKILS